MVLLVVTALLLALAAAVLIAPPVGAHPLGGVKPSNYRTRVLAVRPAVPGLSVTAVDAGTRLRLVNTGRQDVVVLGYQSEPWLRVGPGGVFENSRSPTLRLAADWRRVGSSPSVTWHDHRAHWEAEEPPAQVRRAPGSAQVVVPEWTVKLRTGGRLVDVVGEVRWVPGPSPLPWLVGAALLAMAVVAAGRTRRWAGALVVALGLVVALDLVQVAGAWAGADAPLAGRVPPLGASAAGWVMAALAIRQLLRRRFESGLFQLLLAAGLLTAVGGLGDLGFLFRSQLATGLPDWMVRVAVTAKIGLGVGALAAASLRLRVTVRDWTPAHGHWNLADQDPAHRDWNPADRDPAHRDWSPADQDPADDQRVPVDLDPPVDSPGRPTRRPATLPLRGAKPRAAGFQRARGARTPGAGLQRAPRARPAGAGFPTAREPVGAGSSLATVLPWPGPRRSSDLDDPDLPGGA
jgi:hypothetical protein